jgi:hypothetical protein
LRKQSSEASPHSGREGVAPRTLFVEGATQAPVICAEDERERVESLERNESVCEEYPIPMLIQIYT